MRPVLACSRSVALAAALVLVAAACTGSRSHRPPTTSSSPASTASTATTAAVATTGTSVAGGPVPPGFALVDLTWVSATEGWALGTAPCIRTPCTSIVHTVDGGRSWRGLPAPLAFIPGDPASPTVVCDATHPCVVGLRFADQQVGYAFGPSSLWTTTDGGRSWRRSSSSGVDALEVARGTVWRVIDTAGGGCAPGCNYRVESAPVGSDAWQKGSMPILIGNRAQLVLEGPHLYVVAYENPAGGANDEHPRFARSSDGGTHWTTFADPCGQSAGGLENDASSISAAPGGFLAISCTPRSNEPGADAPFVLTSADGAATFGQRHPVPVAGGPAGLGPIAAASSRRLVAGLVRLDQSSRPISLVTSNDGGVNWQVTLPPTPASPVTTLPGDSYPLVFLGFEDALNGRAVITSSTVQTTSDGGQSWSAYSFR